MVMVLVLDLMVGTLRADNAAAAPPESTDKRGISSSTHTTASATSQTPYTPQTLIYFPFTSSKTDAVEMRQVSSASCTRSHLLPDSDGQPTLGKLHPPPPESGSGGRVAAGEC